MIVTLKTLQQKSFKIEIDEGETVCNVIGRSYVIFKLDSYLCRKVLALKERIEKEQGSAYPVAGQKLIYAGKNCCMFHVFVCGILRIHVLYGLHENITID